MSSIQFQKMLLTPARRLILADLKRTVELWFSKAQSDLRTAKILLQTELPLFEPAVFHCQQAAEKSIKAYLNFHKIRFGKTHDIKELLKLVRINDPALAESLKESEILTQYAVAYRYPEEIEILEPLTPTSAQNILNIATRTYELILNQLK